MTPHDNRSAIDKWHQELQHLLDDGDADEEAIHRYLAATPALLPLHWPYQNRVFSKLPLGREHTTDFAFARKTTLGLLWYFIEIEHPKDRLFRKNGDPTSKLVHGIRQLRDWETWFTRNLAYARDTLPFSASKLRAVAQCKLILIIGRRASLREKDLSRLESLSRDNLEIMTFDRLLAEAGSGCLPQFIVTTCSYHDGDIQPLHSVRLSDGAMPYIECDRI